MKVLIVEDEVLSARRLQKLLVELMPTIQILDIIPTVEETVQWLKDNPTPSLIFLDIHLGDQNSFEIFNHLKVKSPIIFTTAYAEYAIKAFKQNSIDYLLKPIDREDLKIALEKYQTLHQYEVSEIIESVQNLAPKERFLVKKGESYESIPTDEIAYFKSEDKLSFIVTKDGNKAILDESLDKLESKLDQKQFFRINRKMIIAYPIIKKIHSFFNQRLKLDLDKQIKESDDILVSRERVNDFKNWLDR